MDLAKAVGLMATHVDPAKPDEPIRVNIADREPVLPPMYMADGYARASGRAARTRRSMASAASRTAPGDRAHQCLDSVERHLETEFGLAIAYSCMAGLGCIA